jgi:hypothetical protein
LFSARIFVLREREASNDQAEEYDCNSFQGAPQERFTGVYWNQKIYIDETARKTPNIAHITPSILDDQLWTSVSCSQAAYCLTFAQRTHRKYTSGQKIIKRPNATKAADIAMNTRNLKSKKSMAIHLR